MPPSVGALGAASPVPPSNSSPADDSSPPSLGLPELLSKGHRIKKDSVLLEDYITENAQAIPPITPSPGLTDPRS